MNFRQDGDEFFETVEKMQAVVETFASYGSGWVLQQVFQVFINLQSFLESVDHPTLTCFFEFENLRF